MHQSNNPTNHQPIAVLELRHLAELLIKHQNLHEGLYDLSFEFQVAVGAIGPTPETILPGAMFGVRRIGLMKTDKEGPQTVNAAKVNPAKKPSKQKKVAQ